MNQFKDSPEFVEYLAAVQREQFLRDVAWLNLNEIICGIEVKPFTPMHHVKLLLARSPFIVGGVPTPLDVVQFLWVISPKYSATSRLGKFWFCFRLRQKNLPQLMKEIGEYLDEAFMDAPGGAAVARRSYYSFAATFCARLCPKYGWLKEVLAMPYRQLFQLLNCIYEEAGIPISNPSDRVQAKWRAKQNEPILEALRKQGRI